MKNLKRYQQILWNKLAGANLLVHFIIVIAYYYFVFLQVEKDELVTSISINTLNELMTQVLASYCTEISQQLLTELMKQRDLRDQEEWVIEIYTVHF